MSDSDRCIRHLRLAAAEEAAVRRLLPRLEDALRCASLPDGGGQLLLIRSLALGRLPRDASQQTLALLLERRVAAAGGVWLEGDTAASDAADYVRFSSRFAARTQLALRLAAGQPADAWYWPLAVPEYRRGAPAAANLRHIALALAYLPEARAALPAWLASLVAAGRAADLRQAIPPALGRDLARRLGLPSARTPHTAPPAMSAAATAAPTQPDSADWLGPLLAMARPSPSPATRPAPPAAAPRRDASPAPPPADTAPSQRQPGIPLAPPGAGEGRPMARATPSAAPLASQVATRHGESRVALPPERRPRRPAPPAAAPAERGETPPAPRLPSPLHAVQAMGAAPAPQWLGATAAGGLLFLLPVLQRLGIAAWSEQAGCADLPQRVLALAARRLRLDAADPAWDMLDVLPGKPRRRPPPAPAPWSDPLLAPPKARRADGDLAAALARSRGLNAQAALCLTATRRWLRRAARIGLASLVLRPARMHLSPTHVDVHFRLRDCDIRVRRAGLDLDPGWLPWFGRVVAFHYDPEG